MNHLRSAALLLLRLLLLQLLRSDQIQLGFHGQKQLLVGRFFFLFALDLDFLALFALGLLDGLLDLNLLLRLLPLLAKGHAALFHVVALDNLIVPEVLNLALLVFLRLAQVGGHFLQVQSAILLITVGHELGAGATMVDLLELEVGDGLRSEVHLDGRLVGLIVEIPNVDTVVLSDKDNAWTSWAKGATGVLRSTSVC